MFSFKPLIYVALLAMLVMVEVSSHEGGKPLNKCAALRKLYNSKVYKVERMKRPLEGWPFQLGWLSHSGVRVTLEDGTQWLIHKGYKYGKPSNTVVVDTKHMSSKWKIVETKNFQGTKTVRDFVMAGGTDFSLIFDNCHHASCRMIDLLRSTMSPMTSNGPTATKSGTSPQP